jgi:predicted thioredoxin/glutaredoxin
MKETLLPLNFELLSQVPNVYFDNIALATEIIAPHAIEYHLSGQHLAWMA